MSKVVTRALKLKLHPNPDVAGILDSQSRICNWLYNHLLEKANDLRATYRETQDPMVVTVLYTKRGLRNQVPKVKLQHPFLKSVHSSPLKNTALRLTDSIQAYQKSNKGKRLGKCSGWPSFRSWQRQWFSLLYDEPNKGFKIKGEQLGLSLGKNEEGKRHHVDILIQDAHLLQGQLVRNLRIVKQNKIFYAVFTIESALPETKAVRNIIALDPNHKNLSYGVNNHGIALEIESPWWLKKMDKRIDELRGRRDRCKRKARQMQVLDAQGRPTDKTYWCSSKRYQKFSQVLERIYAKRQEQTKSYCYTIANKLVREHDLVVIGDYVPNGGGITPKMRRAMNNRSLIGRFKDTLSWVALKSGKTYDEFNEKGTTRTCHLCQHVVVEGIAPNIRQWTCMNCHTSHLRDENAAINGMYKFLREFELKSGGHPLPVPSSGLVVKQRWAWRVKPSGIVTILRGQDCATSTSAKKLNRTRGSVLSEFALDQV